MNQKIKTNELNKFLKKIITKYQPPSVNGKEIKLKFISQLNISPPVFGIHSTFAKLIPESYKRYIYNKLMEEYNLYGVSIKIIYKQK